MSYRSGSAAVFGPRRNGTLDFDIAGPAAETGGTDQSLRSPEPLEIRTAPTTSARNHSDLYQSRT